MATHLQKWGNSLALRIPKTYADELGWENETPVEVVVVDGKLVVQAVPTPTYSLQELLDRVNPENLHGETAVGYAVGNEIW